VFLQTALFERVTLQKVVFHAFSNFIIFQPALDFLKSQPTFERMKKLNLATAYSEILNF